MRFVYCLLVVLALFVAQSAASSAVSKCASRGGACQDRNKAACATSYVAGLCPGAANIQCCLPRGSLVDARTTGTVVRTPVDLAGPNLCVNQGGRCMSSTGNTCGTGFKKGLCPGDFDIQCCLPPATRPRTSTSKPAFKTLKSCYPQGTADEVKARIGGAVNADWIENTCAIRMSHTLNCAGIPVPARVSGGQNQWIRGRNGDNYIFRVKQLDPEVKKFFGPGIVLTAPSGQRGVDYSPISGKSGIIYFNTQGAWNDASGHFDLWDGSQMVEKEHANSATRDRYFSLSVSVTFWEFK